MIPCIVHQTWKQFDITYWVFKKSQASVKEWLPTWEYKFWTDDDLDDFISSEFPNYHKSWRGLDRTIKRVDVARYLLLHKFGGIYLDLDFVFTDNVASLFTDQHDLYFYQSTQALVKRWDFLGNAFMASSPLQQFWIDVTEYMLNLPSDTPVLHHTGPRALGAYYGMLRDKPKAKIFSPDIFDNSRCADGIGKKKYGYHMRAATWQQRRQGTSKP